MNRTIRSRLSIIAVLFIVPMTFLGCTQEQCESMCELFCFPALILFPNHPWEYWGCIDNCTLQYDCGSLPPGSVQGWIDNPDQCAAMFQLYQEAMQTCEEYPEECNEVLGY